MVNYPTGKKLNTEKTVNYGHRGMSLEDDLNLTNQYYLSRDLAAIYKKPTPVQITKVDYKSRETAKIVEAYFQKPSTTDYNGIYKGKYLDFEAKETHSKTAMTLQMIHPHQLEHLDRVLRYGGIGFLIVRFIEYDETFFVEAKKVLDFIKSATRKSIPYSWFKENGIVIPYNYQIKVDYLKIIDKLYIGGNI